MASIIEKFKLNLTLLNPAGFGETTLHLLMILSMLFRQGEHEELARSDAKFSVFKCLLLELFVSYMH